MSTTEAVQFGRVPYAVIAGGALTAMKPAAGKVYVVLAAHADEHWQARVGMRRIADLAGIELGSVSRSVAQLKEAGLIDTDEASNGQPFTYRIATSIRAKRSPASERSKSKSVHPCANGRKRDRSPAGAPTVHPLARNRSPVGEQNRRTEKNRAQAAPAAGAGAPAKRRRRDPIWDAVVAAFGLNPVTKADRSRVGRIVRDLKQKGATPDDIRLRLGRYRATWPNITATPEALLKHWDQFAAPAGELDADPVEPPDEIFQ